jgi:hypothetical protein
MAPLTEQHHFIFMKSKALLYSMIGLVAAIVVLNQFTRLGTNLWLSTTESEYRIPGESNMLTFVPLMLNQGSGDWWIYGEDGNNYYYHEGEGENDYYILKKSKANLCENFNPVDIETWCK